MPWYAANIIMFVRFKDGVQDSYPVYENIVLIHADSPETAWASAEDIGRQAEGDANGSLKWNGRPAFEAFSGVRKVIEVDHSASEPRSIPAHGSEISYSQFELDSDEALKQLIAGEPVLLRYEE